MKDKILFLLDMEWIHFGIAKFLQNKHDCEMYAVIDIDPRSRFFFQKQKLVQFNKIWYYRDHLPKTTKKPDVEYLKYFEEKYKINLWGIALGERFFYEYNKFYKFDSDEILSILEHECRFFENVLQEIKPDFLIIKLTDSHQSQLLLDLCKALGIKSLMMGPTRFGYRYTIYSDYDNTTNFFTMDTGGPNRSTVELQNYMNKYHALKEITTLESTLKFPIWKKIKKYVQYLSSVSSEDYKNYYAHFGRTKLPIILNFVFLKRFYRKSFVDKNFIRKIEKNTKFIYFPLHYEPERSLLLVAPFYRNQLTVISQIARSLPVDYQLYVKEHAVMYLNAWRDISYYKKLLDIPNVRLVHPTVNHEELMKNCSLLITIAGTAGLEVSFYNKPVIVFADVSYTMLPSVYRLKNIEELPQAIKVMLKKEVDLSALNEYVNLIEKNSFEIDLTDLYLKFDEYFSDEFNSARSSIPIPKMNSFLEKYNSIFEKLAIEHLNKIQQYKKQNT
ncbi:MAG: hypothetical protein E6K98_04295 [Thaumarchaeota archaeon]|nr:MAG: hypothetical protein E6K98_04295 [Nitrososphaerota archaeon]TLX95466.1 MAG: hypothetical protein E6K91_02915 [Nitrososphaerota archaeon]